MEEQLNKPAIIKKDTSATISIITGAAAILLSMGVYPGVILGVVSITFGIISRINNEKFYLKNILGLTYGGIGIILSCVCFIGTLMLFKDPAIRADMMKMFEMYMGY